MGKGLSQTLIAKQLCVRREIIYEYKKVFLSQGLSGLIHLDKPGKETKLTEEMLQQLDILQAKNHKRLSHKELASWLLTTYHLEISPEWLAKRLALRSQTQQKNALPKDRTTPITV